MACARVEKVPKNALRDDCVRYGFRIVMHGLGQGIGIGSGVGRCSEANKAIRAAPDRRCK